MSRWNGRATLAVNVVNAQSVSSRLETVSEKERAMQDRLLREAERILARRGVHTELLCAAGDPVSEILSVAASIHADVIVVARKKGLAPHLVRRSLSSTLVRKAA